MKNDFDKKFHLTPEEEAMDAESGWTPLSPDSPDYKKAMAAIAESKSSKSISIRVDASDLEALKGRAASEGLGYQTLLGSIIHKYVTGRLIDVEQAKVVLETLKAKG